MHQRELPAEPGGRIPRLCGRCQARPGLGAPTRSRVRRRSDTVFVAGNSAGGCLGASAALTQNDPAFQPGFADADTSVTAAIGLDDYDGRTEGGVPESSPEAHLHADAPPFLLIHGSRDSVVPVEWVVDSPRPCGRSPGSRWSGPNCRTRSTRSTTSPLRGPGGRSTRSRPSRPGSAAIALPGFRVTIERYMTEEKRCGSA